MCKTPQALSTTEPAVLHAFEVDFTPAYSRVRDIRRITAAHLCLWDLPSMIEPTTLVVSELVTNSIQHSDGASVNLCVQQRYPDELRVEVADGTAKSARPRAAGPDDESGRGLLIVAAIAREWGFSRGGEVTWCSLAIPRGVRLDIAPNSEQRPPRRSDRPGAWPTNHMGVDEHGRA